MSLEMVKLGQLKICLKSQVWFYSSCRFFIILTAASSSQHLHCIILDKEKLIQNDWQVNIPQSCFKRPGKI